MTNSDYTITRLDVPMCSIGESPWWDTKENILYWIDMLGKKVHRLDPVSGETRSWDVPDIITAMVLGKSGEAIVSLVDGVYTLNLESGECQLLASSPHLNEKVQLADAKTDRKGRFIVGSSHRGMKEPVGKLFQLLAGSNELVAIDGDIILANGPAWSPDGNTFYHADSVRNMIFVYDYDQENGMVSNRREFASTKEFGGIPDGATVDAEGGVWSAICEGGVVVRFTPAGEVDRVIDMPVKLPGSVMFGGPKLDRIYVPTLSPAFLGREADPLDGSLFVIEGLGIQGIPEMRFGA